MKNKIDVKKAVLWGIIGILLLAVVYMTFFNGSVNSVSSLGETARGAQYAGMVGGC